MASKLSTWLGTLTAEQLADVLSRRPDATVPPAPQTLGELATRLQSRESVSIAFRALPLPAVQVIEALQALGGPSVARQRLAETLGRTADDPDLGATLDVLALRALVWPHRDDLCMAGPLWAAFRHPLGLGPPVEHLYANPAVSWALDRGLHTPDGWRGLAMPGEAGAALRGPGWHAPFTPYPPQPPLATAPPAAVARETAAAAGAVVTAVTALLELCAHTPVTLLKAGGVGVRELRRLARALGCTAAGGEAAGGEAAVRLWLELAAHAGLLGSHAGTVLPTEAYDEWCVTEPAQRLVPLLRAWLSLPAVPLASHGPDGEQPSAALAYHLCGEAFVELRRELLRAAADLPQGRGFADAGSLAELAEWCCPLLLHALGRPSVLVSAVWQEATLLGVVAHGAVTPLGRALLGDAGDASGPVPGGLADEGVPLAAIAARLLPAAVPSALFQADLTAVVPGMPAAALAALLDSTADRESRGGAAIWRFSSGSVRRALDAGQSGPGLLDALRAVATGAALPQPLEYLVRDVARRHGQLRVRSVTCVVRADDAALLTEITAVRSLASLRLARLAPTVLGSGKPARETLAALRAAGYAPVTESATGGVVVERAARRRAAPRPRWGRPAVPAGPAARHGDRAATDPAKLARALLATSPVATSPVEAGAGTGAPVRAGAPAGHGRPHLHLVRDYDERAHPVEPAVGFPDLVPDAVLQLVRPSARLVPDSAADLVSAGAPQLNPTEQRLLAEALEHAIPVKIVYTNAQGRSSVRVIEPLSISGYLLEAWCHLRDEERMFSLGRIDAVGPA
ncbi:MAG TPA: helicase C-terminal domain-containing protein [Micromonosporaceae bacterium]|nr:helicase C-terminal domain-containing protein [Micromonosporaceae bacterium]